MSKLFNMRIDEETEVKIEKLKSVYGTKSTSGLIKFLIDCHFNFWSSALREQERYRWLHFEETERHREAWQCEKCGHDITENPRFLNTITGANLDFKFCPFCGAKMSTMEDGRVDVFEAQKGNDSV